MPDGVECIRVRLFRAGCRPDDLPPECKLTVLGMNMRLRELSTVLVVCTVFAVACSEEDDPVEPMPDPPSISGVSATTVSPGDTLIIDGANFVSPASANQVRFTNPLADVNAFEGTSDTLRVVVDQDATSGPIQVTHGGGSDTGPDVTVEREVGDFFVFGGLGPNYVLSLPSPPPTPRYLVIPHGTNANASFSTDFGYEILTANTVALAATRPGPTRRAASTRLGIGEAFDAHRWEMARELIDRVGVPARSAVSSGAPAETEAPPYRPFYVLNTASGGSIDPGDFDLVMADLRYTGTRCLVYADVDTLANPANNFDQIHFQQLGQAFDNSIEPTNVSYFGDYSDIDGNGKVIILITPVVNRMTPPASGGFIAGFFLPFDLYSPPQVPTGTTNQAEIFYLLAADPGAFWGNPFPIDFTAEENIGTSAHEHEHLISASHRIFQEGGASQALWLEEGMAHVAEDLNGMHDANMARADIYLQDPGAISLEHATAPLSQRGGIYLFLRLMVDRYGTDILIDIVQSRCSGRQCVETATGKNFYDLVAEFLAALYLSGKGITTDPRFNFQSINLDDYGTVATFPGLVGVDSAGNVRRSSGDLHLYTGAIGLDTRFTFVENITGVRIRNAIVRVQ